MKTDWLKDSVPQTKTNVPSSFLMIDWTGAQVTVTEVTREGSLLQLGRTYRQAINSEDESSLAEAALWLKQLLKQERMLARQAIVCAPRRYTAFKLLSLPAVSDSRLAEAVHLQCETLFPVVAGDLIIDFVAQDSAINHNQRAVLVAAIPRQQVQRILNCLATAELECRAIVVPELAMARNEVTTEIDAEAIISLGPAKIEFTIRTRSMPIVCYAAKAPADANMPGEIISTLRRLLASIPQSVLNQPITSIRFLQIPASNNQAEAALRQPAWVDQLRRELLIKVSHRFVKREEEMKAHSLLAALLDAQCRIDFANPRKPIDHRRIASRNRMKVAITIAAAALLSWSLARVNTLRLEGSIAALQRQRAELEKQIEKEQPHWQRVALVAQWQGKQLDYSRLLSDYITSLPGAEDLMLTRVEIVQNSLGTGELNVEGLAKNSPCVNQLVNDLINNRQYSKTQLKRLEAHPGDNRYSAEFAISVTLSTGANHVEN